MKTNHFSAHLLSDSISEKRYFGYTHTHEAYVWGPDDTGRMCLYAAYPSMAVASEAAKELNEELSEP